MRLTAREKGLFVGLNSEGVPPPDDPHREAFFIVPTMSKEEILQLPRHQKPEVICGIYFLFRGDEVVYIGQSIAVLGRVSQHVKEEVKIFDSYAFVEYDYRDLDRVEAFLIGKFDPEYNATIPPGQGYLSAHQWTRHFQVPPSLILNFAQQTRLMPLKKWYCKDEIAVFEEFMGFCFGQKWRTSRKRPDFSRMDEQVASFLNR